MSDKMMRIAGRNNDGLAKPIQVDENGALRIDDDRTIFKHDAPILNAGETLDFVFPNRKHAHLMVTYSVASHGLEGSITAGLPNTDAVSIDLYSRINEGTIGGSTNGSIIYTDIEMEYTGLWERGFTSVESMLVLHDYVHVQIKNNLDVPINTFKFVVAGLDVPIKKELGTARVAELGRVVHENVGADEIKLVLELDVRDFPIQTCAVRADASHDFKVEFLYRPDPPANNFFGSGAMYSPIAIIDGVHIRQTSDWVSAQSGTLRVYIHNRSEIAHEYDLVVNGVR